VRIVLDTTVVVSAIRSGSGASAEVIRLVAIGQLTLLLDFKLICEYREVVMRPQHITASGMTVRDAEAILTMLESVATPVLVLVKPRPLSQDRDDDMVIDIAINGHADAIVTNNFKGFRAASTRFGIRVLTPKELLIALKNREA
jgi:putative PIN family toxin of toxin-antitoxin system